MKLTTKYEIGSKEWISQWWIQNFADGGTTPKVGAPAHCIGHNFQKMHKKGKKILEGSRVPLIRFG